MKIDIAAIKQANPLDWLVEQLTNQQAEKHKIRCPFHQDATPSLHIYDDGHWHCFGCGRGGDVLDFAGLFYFGQTYNPDTQLLDVIDRLGAINIQPLTPQERPATQTRKPPEPGITFSLRDVTAWQDKMTIARRQYWIDRGLEKDTISRFRLGWDGRRYTIPAIYRNVCYGVKRRQSDIDDGIPAKYVMAKGSRVGLFNADVLTRVDEGLPLFVVEGEIEAMLIDQHGFPAVSSTGGAGTWKPHWNRYLAHIRRIIIIYDNDEAGMSGALKVRSRLHRARLAHWPPEYKDGGDFLPACPDPWEWLHALAKT